jgi:peptide deformylase
MLITNARDLALRTKSTPVYGKEDWAKLPALVKKMTTAMKAEKGLGLAANQIGVMLRVFVMYDGTVMVNPRITEFKGFRQHMREGCLSLPGKSYSVERFTEVNVSYQDIEGTNHTEHCTGIDAQLIQHEIDHLNGELISDKWEIWK